MPLSKINEPTDEAIPAVHILRSDSFDFMILLPVSDILNISLGKIEQRF